MAGKYEVTKFLSCYYHNFFHSVSMDEFVCEFEVGSMYLVALHIIIKFRNKKRGKIEINCIIHGEQISYTNDCNVNWNLLR